MNTTSETITATATAPGSDKPKANPNPDSCPKATLDAGFQLPTETSRADPAPQPTRRQCSSVLDPRDALSETEAMQGLVCDALMTMIWSNYVQAGLALARIRDLRLYRVQFGSFEAPTTPEALGGQ